MTGSDHEQSNPINTDCIDRRLQPYLCLGPSHIGLSILNIDAGHVGLSHSSLAELKMTHVALFINYLHPGTSAQLRTCLYIFTLNLDNYIVEMVKYPPVNASKVEKLHCIR